MEFYTKKSSFLIKFDIFCIDFLVSIPTTKYTKEKQFFSKTRQKCLLSNNSCLSRPFL